MHTANSAGAGVGSTPTNANQQELVDCSDCGDPTPPDDLKDGFCSGCRARNADYLGLEGEDSSDGEGIEPPGSALA